ncbi:hypothetical protein N658DRAFT_489899 [Parathielavia hyrcaniae]|uniref:Uncharacterized protein n=1 Tax=Parathielavia hyrcaniae TaxID=113614 RepID=A0AAN6PRR0_9PEZI|nr:hypothetical protein N658DRAFT_489899 [Parathielavia hyrcaniae]
MAEIKTFSVRHHWDNSPNLTSWTIQEKPCNRISWTPHTTARPKRLRKAECREVFKSVNSLPAIQVHGAACHCSGEALDEDRLEDTLLAAKISALTESLLAHATVTTKTPPPSRSSLKRSQSIAGTTASSPLPKPTSFLSTLSRLFSPAPSLSTGTTLPSSVKPSIAFQADLCIGASELDLGKVARHLVHSTPPLPVNAPNHLGVTPLMAAVRSPAAASRPTAQLEMVRFLVEGCGADVEATRVDRVTGLGESVLGMACAAGAGEVVRYLTGRGVVVDRRLHVRAQGDAHVGRGLGVGFMRGQTALHVAVLADRAECVEILVREGKADVNAVLDASEEEAEGRDEGLRALRGRTRNNTYGLVSWQITNVYQAEYLVPTCYIGDGIIFNFMTSAIDAKLAHQAQFQACEQLTKYEAHNEQRVGRQIAGCASLGEGVRHIAQMSPGVTHTSSPLAAQDAQRTPGVWGSENGTFRGRRVKVKAVEIKVVDSAKGEL